jgi:3-isopropylmalate dehydrogenase
MKIAILPGDGVGPEVTAAAIEVLNEVAPIYGISFESRSALIGGAAIR